MKHPSGEKERRRTGQPEDIVYIYIQYIVKYTPIKNMYNYIPTYIHTYIYICVYIESLPLTSNTPHTPQTRCHVWDCWIFGSFWMASCDSPQTRRSKMLSPWVMSSLNPRCIGFGMIRKNVWNPWETGQNLMK